MSDMLKHLISPYLVELDAIKGQLRNACDDIMDEGTSIILNNFVSRGGHMLRPSLVLVTYHMLSQGDTDSSEEVIRLGAAIELLHTASLVHDDVLDESELRRNAPTFNKLYGNHSAILMGNLFYVASFKIALGFNNPYYVNTLLNTTELMCIGEIRQNNLSDSQLSEMEYLDILEKKSGRLVATALKLAARLAGASESTMALLEQLGLTMGVLYQLNDDASDQDATNVDKAIGEGLKIKKSQEAEGLILALQKNLDFNSNHHSMALFGILDYLRK